RGCSSTSSRGGGASARRWPYAAPELRFRPRQIAGTADRTVNFSFSEKARGAAAGAGFFELFGERPNKPARRRVSRFDQAQTQTLLARPAWVSRSRFPEPSSLSSRTTRTSARSPPLYSRRR